jgi:hypothetical protein
MRALLIPAAIAAILTAAPVAFAGDDAVGTFTGTATGIVKSVDVKADLLTMSDGSVYVLPAGAPHLKAGEKIRVTFDVQGPRRVADHIAIVG